MIRLLVAFLLIAPPASAAELLFRSGPARARLLELYSSEGCSSCPPADAWVAPLTTDARLWKDFVPVAFHVDYWDFLGWKDRFASPAFSARQRAYAAGWGSRSVYTPGFVLDGEEWRGWGGDAPRAGGKTGVLSARWKDGTLSVRFVPEKGGDAGAVFATRLGFGCESKVTAGENGGRALRHEFVAREAVTAALKMKGGARTAVLRLPPASGPACARGGFAAWVTGSDGRPVQAVGGMLP
jgi:hypothetical protein